MPPAVPPRPGRCRGRGKNAPAVDEQLGEAGVRPGMLRARDRMGRDEMHARGNVRGHVAHHRAFDRADVGDGGGRGQMRPDLRCDRAAGAHRDAENDEIGAFHGRGIGFDHVIGEAELGDAAARGGERAVATIDRAAPCARAARAIDEPIKPIPMSARRLKTAGALICRP